MIEFCLIKSLKPENTNDLDILILKDLYARETKRPIEGIIHGRVYFAWINVNNVVYTKIYRTIKDL